MSIRCAYAECRNSWPAPFHDTLRIHIHGFCEEAWWEEMGPWPRPAMITITGGRVKQLGVPFADAVILNDDDPELLRRRGVYT